jgi:arylsulfatase A-like enzyme
MKLSFTLLAALLLSPLAALQAADKPNIIVILADDLGYGDVRCYNPQRGKIPTPNIDRLASQGMRFTDAHSSSAVCSPSRYALLTGRYHWRTRLQSGIVGVFGEPLIAPDRMTIGTLAKQHGYRTAAIGKWHLGWDWPIPENKRKLFTNLGGKAGGGGGDIVTTVTDAHRSAWREVFSQPIPGGPTARGFDEYFGTEIPNWPPYCFIENDRTLGIPSELLAVERLTKNQASLQGPALPGWKFEPVLPKLADRACDFITRQAKARTPFLLYLPLTTPHTPLAVNEAWRGKSGLDNAAADLIMETDDVVGRVLSALEASGVAGETLVLFTSDNGFAPYVGAADLEKRGHYPSGPLRGYKFDVWEGGHREPFIVRWPGVVKPDGVCGQLVHQADILRTLADILGTKLPDNAGEDSFSLLPLLKGGDKPVRPHAVSCAGAGTPGLRNGAWKFIPGKNPELYNLAQDIGETKNLACDKPELVDEMKVLLEQLITDGRSTPGSKQQNDIKVRRFPGSTPTSKAEAGKTNPRTSAQPSSQPPITPISRPLLLANYYCWYHDGQHPKRPFDHWAYPASAGKELANKAKRAGEPSPNSVFRPLAGLYDSADPKVAAWHVQLAKAAGIDAFLVSWWDTHNALDQNVDRGIVDAAGKHGFKFALFDERAQFHQKFEDYQAMLARAMKRYKDHPAYLRIDGRPVVYLYQVASKPGLTAAEFPELKQHVEDEVGPVYWIVDKITHDHKAGGDREREKCIPADWLSTPGVDSFGFYSTFSNFRAHEYDSLVGRYRYLTKLAHDAGKKMLLPIHPGHDNSHFADNPYIMPRRDGQTLRDFLHAATDAGADYIMVTSWNEWPESTVVEPSSSWPDPYQYLRILAEWKGISFIEPPHPEPAK